MTMKYDQEIMLFPPKVWNIDKLMSCTYDYISCR